MSRVSSFFKGNKYKSVLFLDDFKALYKPWPRPSCRLKFIGRLKVETGWSFGTISARWKKEGTLPCLFCVCVSAVRACICASPTHHRSALT